MSSYSYHHLGPGGHGNEPSSKPAVPPNGECTPGLETGTAWDEERRTPGLQVAWQNPDLNGQPGLQVTNQPDYHAAQGLHPWVPEGQAQSTAPKVQESFDDDSTVAPATQVSEMNNKGKKKRKRWLWWAFGGVVAALVVIGATVGGVLGSKSSRTSSWPIQHNSRLAASASLNTSTDYALRLFSQSPDNVLQYVEKTSDGSWSQACKVNSLGRVEGSIGLGLFRASKFVSYSCPSIQAATDPAQYQWQLFFVDGESTIKGQGFNVKKADAERQGGGARINNYPVQVGSGTRLGCFWPHIVSQDSDGKLRWTQHVGGNSSDQSFYENSTLNVVGSPGTGIAVLPVTKAAGNATGFVYIDEDGLLRTGVRTFNEEVPDTDVAWHQNELATLRLRVPPKSAIAAFAVGRPKSKKLINTYILYQDEKGVIQVVWQDDASGWRGPETYPALDNAEEGTDIACATMGGGNVGSSREFELRDQKDVSRCFFQEKGTKALREVWYDGNEWHDVGHVPINYGDGQCR